MKKLGLLIAGAFILASCDSSPGGNRDVLPVVHDGVKEEMDHHGGDHAHEGHENHATEGHAQEANQVEKTDSTAVNTHQTEEKKDSAH